MKTQQLTKVKEIISLTETLESKIKDLKIELEMLMTVKENFEKEIENSFYSNPEFTDDELLNQPNL